MGDRGVRLVWEFLHNCVAHPLLFWTRDARAVVQLHDVSARRAWPWRELRPNPTAKEPGDG